MKTKTMITYFVNMYSRTNSVSLTLCPPHAGGDMSLSFSRQVGKNLKVHATNLSDEQGKCTHIYLAGVGRQLEEGPLAVVHVGHGSQSRHGPNLPDTHV